MIKKILLVGVFAVMALFTKAQTIDVGANPLGALFGSYTVFAEYGLSDNMGLELDLSVVSRSITGVKYGGFSASLPFKYYFKPSEGGDKFYVFPYLQFSSATANLSFNSDDYKVTYSGFGLGGGLGYKIVSSSNIVFDIALGYGRNFVDNVKSTGPEGSSDGSYLNINGYGKLGIGYRF